MIANPDPDPHPGTLLNPDPHLADRNTGLNHIRQGTKLKTKILKNLQ